jgi:hypothetical protein
MKISKIIVEYCYEVIEHSIEFDYDIIKLFKYLLLDDKIIYKINIYITDINILGQQILYMLTSEFHDRLINYHDIDWYFCSVDDELQDDDELQESHYNYNIIDKINKYISGAKKIISTKDILITKNNNEYINYSFISKLKNYIEKDIICYYTNTYEEDFGDGDLFEYSKRCITIYRYKYVYNFVLKEDNEFIFYICSSDYIRSYEEQTNMLIKYKLNIRDLLLWDEKNIKKLFSTIHLYERKVNDKEYNNLKIFIRNLYSDKLIKFNNKLPDVIVNQIVEFIV